MLWLITGGLGCGKSAFAEDLAQTLGGEGIKLTCPPFPLIDSLVLDNHDHELDEVIFPWRVIPADETFADKLNAINRGSNIFRADQRILVLDSLSGLLRHLLQGLTIEQSDNVERLEVLWQDVIRTILTYQGKIIIVTEETAAGLALSPLEQWFVYKLAAANRILSEESHMQYRLTAGVASEVKGYRVKKRRRNTDENIYTDR
jgi:adenosylcobinamide kinase/adenosylcobinamide-phosphate guanylyltransferase